jgi:hypothetical protein
MTSKGRIEEAKSKMHRDNAVFLVIITLLGAAMVAEYLLGVDARLMTVTIIMFVAFSVVMIARMLMADHMISPGNLPDERTEKVEAYARSRAWYLTFLTLCLLIGLTAFGIIDISTYVALIIIFFIMSYSWIGFRWYYNRRGDVE